MILFIILTLVGIALLVLGVTYKKKYKVALMTVGVLMLTVGAVMIFLTLYFAWAVRNDAPGSYDDTRVETEST